MAQPWKDELLTALIERDTYEKSLAEMVEQRAPREHFSSLDQPFTS